MQYPVGGAAVAPSLWGCGIPADCSRFLSDHRKRSGYTDFRRDAPVSFWKLGCYTDPWNLKYNICTAATDKSFQGASILMIFVGVSLIIDSIQNFYSIYCISKAIKASKSNQVIDVEWYSVG